MHNAIMALQNLEDNLQIKNIVDPTLIVLTIRIIHANIIISCARKSISQAGSGKLLAFKFTQI
jgi:hypothetical protein